MKSTPCISKSVADTNEFAQSVLMNLGAHKKGATVLCLSGDLGSGKTAFVKEVGEILGIPKNEITSPTFVIMKIFDLSGDKAGIKYGTFTRLIHIDAYRLESAHELEVLGWDEIVSDTHNLICIEWPERVEKILPKNSMTIDFKFIDEVTRAFSLKLKT